MLKQQLQTTLHRIAEKGGLLFYTKSQIYNVTYRVTITNTDNAPSTTWVVAPVPSSDSQQSLKSDIHFTLTPHIDTLDNTYGNHYIAWFIRLNAGETTHCQLSFKIEVSPSSIINKLAHKSDRHRYLKSNKFINADNNQIAMVAKKISEDSANFEETVLGLNQYVIKTLTYGKPIMGLYSANEALKNLTVDCGGFNTLLVSLCVAAGIPARPVLGFWSGYKNNSMHAWIEIMRPDDTWMPADPSIEQLAQRGKTWKSGRFNYVGSDRIIFSAGSDIDIQLRYINKKIAILQHPTIFNDDGNLNKNIKVKTEVETNII